VTPVTKPINIGFSAWCTREQTRAKACQENGGMEEWSEVIFDLRFLICDLRDDVPNPVEAGNRSLVVWPGGGVVRSLQPTAGMLLTNA
jgi:hypothetical protein